MWILADLFFRLIVVGYSLDPCSCLSRKDFKNSLNKSMCLSCTQIPDSGLQVSSIYSWHGQVRKQSLVQLGDERLLLRHDSGVSPGHARTICQAHTLSAVAAMLGDMCNT